MAFEKSLKLFYELCIEIRISGRILTISRLVVIEKEEKGLAWAVVRKDFINLVCEEPRLICRK